MSRLGGWGEWVEPRWKDDDHDQTELASVIVKGV